MVNASDQGDACARFESLLPPILNFPPQDDVCLGVYLTCHNQRVEDNRIRRESQLCCLHQVND